MKAVLAEIRGSVVATLVLAFACCGVYPLVVYGIAQTAFPTQANGSLIRGPDGAVRGSSLLGQGFSGDRYFHPRPSAAGNGYDAASSGGSNLGPTSRKLRDAIQDRVKQYREENGLGATVAVPADAVTASGSGLDPHISTANAALQIPRVARVRRLPEEKVRALVGQYTEPPDLGVFGETRVLVLPLNLALDSISAGGGSGGSQ